MSSDSPKSPPTVSPKNSKTVIQPEQPNADTSEIKKATSSSPSSKNDKTVTPTPSPVFISKRTPLKVTRDRRIMNKKLARLERLKAQLNGIMLARTSPYRPFDNRDVPYPNSYFKSLINLVMASLGTGLLAMPLAMSKAGYAAGIVMTIIIGCICTHCVHIFVLVARGICNIELVPKLGYAETCEACFKNGPEWIRRFSHFAGRLARWALFCTYFGNCCIYTVIIIDSVKQICDEYFFHIPILKLYYGLAVLVPLALLVQPKELKYLAPLAVISNVLLAIVCGACFYYIFRDVHKIGLKDKNAYGKPMRFPSYLTTVLFVMEGIGVVMPVENQMADPSRFLGCSGILNNSMAMVVGLYILLGFFGYIRYGKDVKPSITLNLPMDEWPAVAAKVSIALLILFSYPLHFFVLYKAAVKWILPKLCRKYQYIQHALIKVVIVCICGAVGISIPMLQQVIGLVGALLYSMLGLIIPASVDLVYHAQDYGDYKFILWKDLLLLMFGFFVLVSGTAVTLNDIYNHYTE